MARGVQTDLDLGQHSLVRARIENLASPPDTPVVGRVYFDTTLGQLRTWTGSMWYTGGSIPGVSTFVQATQPPQGTPTPYVWVQTFPNGDVSFWVEDGR